MRIELFFIALFVSLPAIAQIKTGDNLGNHKAVKDLEMSNQRVINASGIVIGSASFTNNSVQLELSSANKAFLLNRVANTAAIAAPVDGMLVYSNADNKMYLRQGSLWISFASIGDINWSNLTGKPLFSAVAISGSYNDLINKPSFPGNVSAFTNDVGYINASALTWNNISSKPGFANVAVTGNYNDLINKPFIPAYTSSLINDAGFITTWGRAYPRRSDGTAIDFIWSGQSGQPTWLWGSNDGINHYVWNPANFSVNYANTAGSATSAINASNAINATYGRYVYNNGNYSGSGWMEASELGVRYAASAGSTNNAINAVNATYGRYVYNNGAWSGSGWVEASDLGVRYANSAGSAGYAGYAGSAGYIDWGSIGNKPSAVSSFVNDVGYVSAYSSEQIFGKKYFLSNTGGQYLAYSNEPALQAFSTDGGTAMMSFHRSGNFAINMGLDPDNVFRWGGWSIGGQNLLELDMLGTLSARGYMYAQQFFQTSDRKLKNILTDIPAPKNVLSIKLRAYNFKADSSASLHFGYIAQEVERIIPGAVKTRNQLLNPISKKSGIQTANTQSKPPFEAIKEVNYIEVHNVMINELITEINQLRKEMTKLKKLLSKK
jgi:hypothetical protein